MRPKYLTTKTLAKALQTRAADLLGKAERGRHKLPFTGIRVKGFQKTTWCCVYSRVRLSKALRRGSGRITALPCTLGGEPDFGSQHMIDVSALCVVSRPKGSALYDALGCVLMDTS